MIMYTKVRDFMNKQFKCFIVLLLIVGTLFININAVNAEQISTADGYARCVYGGEVQETRGPVEWKSLVYVVIRIYRDTDNVVRAYGNMLSTKGYTNQSIVNSDEFHTDISNYNDLFHHANDELLAHYRHTSWYCNPQVYVKLDNIENPSSAQLSMFPSSGYSSISLSEDYSSFSNEPVTFDSNDDVTDDFPNIRSEAWESHVEDQEEAYEDISGVTSNSNKVNTQAIIDWAEQHGYPTSIDSIGDPCQIIDGSLKKILNSAFWIISIAGIILLVVMTAISFIKAIVGSDDEKLRDAISHLFTRIIVVIILLLLPMLLSFIITLINNTVGDGKVSVGSDGNVFCDVNGVNTGE